MTEYREHAQNQAKRPRRALSAFALWGLALAILVALAALSSGLGHRSGWWDFGTGFLILRWAGYFALVAVGVSLVGSIRARRKGPRRGLAMAILGVVVGLAVVGIPWSYLRSARDAPPIHDITTDTENPPRFVAVLSLREDAPNPAGYGGPTIAAEQKKAYPDLGPVVFDVPPDQVFERAVAVGRAMGWEVAAAVPSEGRIEATDRTFWFGFKDDVVVRITRVAGGSRVDVRSVSRVGRGDLGTNARRIRTFLKKLRATVTPSAK